MAKVTVKHICLYWILPVQTTREKKKTKQLKTSINFNVHTCICVWMLRWKRSCNFLVMPKRKTNTKVRKKGGCEPKTSSDDVRLRMMKKDCSICLVTGFSHQSIDWMNEHPVQPGTTFNYIALQSRAICRKYYECPYPILVVPSSDDEKNETGLFFCQTAKKPSEKKEKKITFSNFINKQLPWMLFL